MLKDKFVKLISILTVTLLIVLMMSISAAATSNSSTVCVEDYLVQEGESVTVKVCVENNPNILNSVKFEMFGETIKALDYIPGDVNGDGRINGNDVTFLRRYITGGYEVIIDLNAADVNDDGRINGTDITLIRRYIAGGYDVELKPSKTCFEHKPVDIEGIEATCTSTGLTDGSMCSKCGEIIVAQEVIPVKDHTEVIDAPVEPTCTETGLTEGKHCSVCDTITVAQQVIDTLEHIPEDIDYSTVDFCLGAPVGDVYCKNCGEYLESYGHKYTVTNNPATCTEDGKNTYTCIRCGDFYCQIINKHGHLPGNWETVVETSCTEEGQEQQKCLICYEVLESITIDKEEHTYSHQIKGNVVIYQCVNCNHSYSEIIGSEDVYHTITFVENGGSEVPDQYVKKGTILSIPMTSKKDHVFAGWFYDGEFNNPYYEEEINNDIVLYAKWLDIVITKTDTNKIIEDVGTDFTFEITSNYPITDDNVNNYVVITDIEDKVLNAKIISVNGNTYTIGCDYFQNSKNYFVTIADEISFVNTEGNEIWIFVEGEDILDIQLKDGVKSVSSVEIYTIYEFQEKLLLFTYDDIFDVGDLAVIYTDVATNVNYVINVKREYYDSLKNLWVYEVEDADILQAFDNYEISYSDKIDFTNVVFEQENEEQIQAAFENSETFALFAESARLLAKEIDYVPSKPRLKIKVIPVVEGYYIHVEMSIELKYKADGDSIFGGKDKIIISNKYTTLIDFDLDAHKNGLKSTLLLTKNQYTVIETNVSFFENDKAVNDKQTEKTLMDKLEDISVNLSRAGDARVGYSKSYSICKFRINYGIASAEFSVSMNFNFKIFGECGVWHTEHSTSKIGIKDGKVIQDNKYKLENFQMYGVINAHIGVGVNTKVRVALAEIGAHIKLGIGAYLDVYGSGYIAKYEDNEPFYKGTIGGELGLEVSVTVGVNWKIDLGIWEQEVFDFSYKVIKEKFPLCEFDYSEICLGFAENEHYNEDNAIIIVLDCFENKVIDINEIVNTEVLIHKVFGKVVIKEERNCLVTVSQNNALCKIINNELVFFNSAISGDIIVLTVNYNDVLHKQIYIKISEKHSEKNVSPYIPPMISDAAVAPTCTETGLTEGSHCTKCDYKVVQQRVPALGHLAVKDDGDCTTPIMCGRCHDVVTQAKSHSYDNLYCDPSCNNENCTYKRQAGHNYAGVYIYESQKSHYQLCQNGGGCNDKYRSEHSGVPDTQPPKCEESGYSRIYCPDCNYNFEYKVLDPIGHGNWEYKYQDDNVHQAKCTNPDCSFSITGKHNMGDTSAEDADGLYCVDCLWVKESHSCIEHLTKIPYKQAQCEKEGNIQYWVCTCKRWYSDADTRSEIFDKNNVVLPKLEHNYELKHDQSQHWYQCSLCQDTNNFFSHSSISDDNDCTTDIVCSVCNEIISQGAASHTLLMDNYTKDVTGGYIVVIYEYCTYENCQYEREIARSDTYHVHNNPILVEGIEPTCTNIGYSYAVKCGDCGKILTAAEEISAPGHNYIDGVCVNCEEIDINYILPITPITYTWSESKTVQIGDFWGYHPDYRPSNFDLNELKALGYKNVTFTITFDMKEKYDGYQILEVYLKDGDDPFEYYEFTHGGGGANESWATYSVTFTASIDSLRSNGTFQLSWGARGNWWDDWYLGNRTIIMMVT